MIVEFSVKNFRSIKELQTLSFVATGLKSPPENSEVDKNNIVEEGGLKLLKTIGIYGANASGKSNIIKALAYFFGAIQSPMGDLKFLRKLCDPFLYQDGAESTESFFQIVFILERKKYRYGFTVKRNNDNDGASRFKEDDIIVAAEWLYGTKEKNSVCYFKREGLTVDKNNLPGGDEIPPINVKHNLFLAHAAAFNLMGICYQIVDEVFRRNITNIYDGYEKFRRSTVILITENLKTKILELLSSFNLKYDDIILEKNDNDRPVNFPHNKIFLVKNLKNGKQIMLNLEDNETAGTKIMVDLA